MPDPAAVNGEPQPRSEELRVIELELRRQNEQLRALIENISDIITIISEDGTIRYESPSIERILGYRAEDLIGKNVVDFIHPEDTAATVRTLKAAFGKAGVAQSTELRFRHRDGSWRVIEVIGKRPTNPPDIAGVVVNSRDVTERKRIEAEARQHQAELCHLLRLSTVGEMAAGLAHELNQPLAAITNYAKGCARRIVSSAGKPSQIVPALEEIAAQAMRAGDIIRRLRNLSRKGEVRREPVEVNEIVREVARFVDAEVHERAVRLQLDLAPQLPQVCADAIEMEQVILNLVRNGLEAVSGVEGGARELRLRTTAADDTLEIAISDTGEGLAADVAEKMFDPFFSTKPGVLGMGLSISRSIVEAHGGRLWATPNLPRGTTFRFTLPVNSNIAER
ncbi:MAG: PAS domain S-box protein [Candidatus Binatia bacterium]|jgi:two-component system, LuxR family, sensor kinase FixL